MSAAELLRAPFFHTPANAFNDARALVCHEDGGLLIEDGRIVASGDYETVRWLLVRISRRRTLLCLATLAGAENVREVRVEGSVVYRAT